MDCDMIIRAKDCDWPDTTDARIDEIKSERKLTKLKVAPDREKTTDTPDPDSGGDQCFEHG